jgi:succinate dehydrogenase subunit A (EC 1.3.5.1)
MADLYAWEGGADVGAVSKLPSLRSHTGAELSVPGSGRPATEVRHQKSKRLLQLSPWRPPFVSSQNASCARFER